MVDTGLPTDVTKKESFHKPSDYSLVIPVFYLWQHTFQSESLFCWLFGQLVRILWHFAYETTKLQHTTCIGNYLGYWGGGSGCNVNGKPVLVDCWRLKESAFGCDGTTNKIGAVDTWDKLGLGAGDCSLKGLCGDWNFWLSMLTLCLHQTVDTSFHLVSFQIQVVHWNTVLGEMVAGEEM